MVVTQVEAHVSPDRWSELRESYRRMTTTLEPQLLLTYLLQSTHDRTHWRVVTVWKSQESLDEYLQSVETPGAFILFRNVGAEPAREIFEVAEHASH